MDILDVINKLGKILGKELTKKLYFVLILIIISGFVEMIGVGLIPIFIITISDPDKIINTLDLLGIHNSELLNFNSANFIYLITILLVVIFLLKNIYLYYYLYKENIFLKKVNTTLVSKIYHWYISRPFDNFSHENPASLIQSLVKDLDDFRSYIRHLMTVLRELCLLIFTFMLLAYIDFLLTLSSAIFLGGISSYFLILNKKYLSKHGSNSQKYRLNIQKFLQESLSSIKIIKIYNLENIFFKKIQFLNEEKEYSEFSYRLIAAQPKLLLEFLAVMGITMVVFYFSLKDYDNSVIIPILALLGISFVRIIPSLNSLTASLASMKYFGISENKLLELINLIDFYKSENKEHNYKLSEIKFNDKELYCNLIELENICYKYPTSKYFTLENLNLSIKKNELLVVTGESGSGKSTLLDLIIGLKKPNSGSIRINSNRFNSMKNNELRIGYVPQEPFLFDDSIKKNIAIGLDCIEIDSNKLWKALSIAKIDSFVKSLPEGLDSVIGNQGMSISGGQRQRLSLARALYFDPSILIIDEGTSALDRQTEKEIMEILSLLKKSLTIIIVSHQPANHKYGDRVVSLIDGKIIQIN